MKRILDLSKYFIVISNYFFINKNIDRKPKYIQTDRNCWIYSVLNNCYFNTGLLVDGDNFEKEIVEYGFDSSKGGKPRTSGLILCGYLEKDNLYWYEIPLLKDNGNFDLNSLELFGKLLKKGVVFSYSRINNKDLLKDIRDNKIINYTIPNKDEGWHATNIYFKDGHLYEIGTYGDDNIYNSFSYDNINIFMESVKKGTIKSVVRFIGPSQDRPYINYRNKMLGGRVDYDKSYGYQCVDLFKDYCKQVLLIPLGKTGNANDIWYNKYKIFGDDWKQIKGTENLIQGDVVISVKGKYGHIGIFDHYENGLICVLEQNGSGSPTANGTNGDEIRVKKYDPKFYVGAWRNKTIISNFEKELSYIGNKIKTEGLNNNKEYLNSIGKI